MNLLALWVAWRHGRWQQAHSNRIECGVLGGWIGRPPMILRRKLAQRRFNRTCANLGWVVGRNLQIDYRWGAINDETAQRFGADLLSLNPDVILSGATPATKALQSATQTVPIVFVLIAEPVGQGLFGAWLIPAAI